MLFIETKNSIQYMQINNTNVKINLNHLLWRTRSKNQDYQFINSPKSPSVDRWFSLFNEVFSGREPGREPKNITGKLVATGDNHESESFPFIASCFVDDKYSDSSGRPIKQYLIWFHRDYDTSEINKLLADDWSQDFVSSSSEVYSSFYESSDISTLAEKEYIVIKKSGADLQKLDFEDIGEIKYGLHEVEPLPAQPFYSKIIVILTNLLKKVIRS